MSAVVSPWHPVHPPHFAADATSGPQHSTLPAAPQPTTEQAPTAPQPGWRDRTVGERAALLTLLVATAALYCWNLSSLRWANSFYSAAAQAGASSWKALLFGSSDAANSITVDKPPAALWIMGLSVRVFGLNSWAILVPQALMGVATVGTVYATVRRHFSAVAALVAGATLALTPAATLMFRFNNPDALLVLCMALAAYTTLRAAESERLGWCVATGALIGFGFLAKQLQVFLVVPGFALVYVVAARGSLVRRIKGLGCAGFGIVLGAGWWLAIVQLTPARYRPYIGGSQHNSIVELTFGYNGFGRLTGNEVGSVGGGPRGGPSMWGATGITRLFDGVAGGQITWFAPVAMAALTLGLVFTRRRPRTDASRAQILVWGTWMLVTAVTFSFMQGIYHDYYTVALAPAVAALAGIGVGMLWDRRDSIVARATLVGLVLCTVGWAAVLLHRSPDWAPWLRGTILGVGVVATLGLLLPTVWRRPRTLAAGGAILASLAGPAAWSVATVANAQQGSIVTAGPSVNTGFGPGGRMGAVAPGPLAGTKAGGFPGPVRGARPGGLLSGSEPSAKLVALLNQDAERYTWVAAAVGSNSASGYQLATRKPVMPIGGFNGSDPSPTLAQFQKAVRLGKVHWFIEGMPFGGPGGFGAGPGGMPGSPPGGMPGSPPGGMPGSPPGGMPGSPPGGMPGSPPGGMPGSPPGGMPGSPQFPPNGTLPGTGPGAGPGGPLRNGPMGVTSPTSDEIRNWVVANFAATTVDGITLYDLTREG